MALMKKFIEGDLQLFNQIHHPIIYINTLSRNFPYILVQTCKFELISITEISTICIV